MFQAAVIGLGQIGALYDLNPKNDMDEARSHLGAIVESNAFDLAFAYDVDQSNYADIASKWGLDSAVLKTDISDFKGALDLLVFATPPVDRCAELELAIKLDAKAVIFEKPLVQTIEDAKRLLALKKESGFSGKIYVNFHRRFSDKYMALKADIEKRTPDRVTCFYAKGLKNYASHHVDLIQHWFGKVTEVQSFGDLSQPNLSFSMMTETGVQVDCLGLPDPDYDLCDMQLWFQDRRIDIVCSGVEVHKYSNVPDKYYNGYGHLSPAGDPVAPQIVTGMKNLYTTMAETLSDPHKISPACTLEEAVHVASVIDSVSYSAKNAGIKHNVKDF